MELDREAQKTPEINPLDITHDKKQKEKRRVDQFFSSLLARQSFQTIRCLAFANYRECNKES